jgi:NDP-sugar pyrophosphorylase family protein
MGSGATAIILAGGLGSRLGAITADVPKPMLPVGGRPFVEYLVIRLARSGFQQIVFATGHQSEVIRRHFGDGSPWGLSIRYSHEMEPRGTAGAMKHAAGMTTDDPLAFLNGDSFLDIDPRLVLDAVGSGLEMTMALALVGDARRFGRVELAPDGTVVGFSQGDEQSAPASINAGMYGIRRSVLDRIPSARPSSLERDILPRMVGKGLLGIQADGYFVDIGIPEVYRELEANPEPLLAAVGVGAVA